VKIGRVVFAPAPWSVQPLARKRGIAPAEVGIYSEPAPEGLKLVASTWGPQAKVNAHLIAAAPDLLAALKRLVDIFDDDLIAIENPSSMDAARAAIGKAEGRL